MTKQQAISLLHHWQQHGNTLFNLPKFQPVDGAIHLYLPDETNTYLLYGKFDSYQAGFAAYGSLLDEAL